MSGIRASSHAFNREPKYGEKKKRLGSCQGSHNAILSQYAINCGNYPVCQERNLTLVNKNDGYDFI